MPYEAVIVAALNFGTKLLELVIEDRNTMDPEIRKRFDSIRIAGLERVERILSSIEKLGK
tara:strand:+ start:131 stop:310 length:180 start_codon:yes stop_codon:yes gene_type:complete